MRLSVFLILFIAIAAACRAEPLHFDVKELGKGPSMILIPGLNSDGAVWDGLVEHYAKSYRTQTLTLNGFAGLPLEGEASLEAVKNELLSYIKASPEPVTLVGHSLGGFLALWVASESSDAVAKVVAIDSLPFFPLIFNPMATEENMREPALQQTQPISTSTLDMRRQYYTASIPGLVSSDTDIARVIEWGMISDPRMTAQSMYELYTNDLRDDLAKVKAPTLVLGSWIAAKNFGGTVESVKAQFDAQYAALPNYTLRMHDSAKHFIMLDAPQWTLDTMDAFLQ